MKKNILVLDDDLIVCLMLRSWLVKKGFAVETALSVKEAQQKIKEFPFDLILSDIRMPEADGFSLLSWVKRHDSDIVVIMMTGRADIESAVAAMKSGAADYISKPIKPELLFSKIEEAFHAEENRHKSRPFSNDFLKPPGKEYQQVFAKLDFVTENNTHLLIIGDRGTGKSSAVKYVYGKGFSLSKPLVVCDANQLNDAQYGGDRDACFPGSTTLLEEKLKEASGGLLNLQKFDRLHKNLQNCLLDLLTRQNRDDRFIRVILTTEASLKELEQKLIPKLFFLFEKNVLTMPVLKGKKEVIRFFLSHFLRFANYTLDKQIEDLAPEVETLFVHYEWPGNIRQLKNCVIKAALLTDGKRISAEMGEKLFEMNHAEEQSSVQTALIDGLRKENYEKEKIRQALELSKGNKTLAAELLNIDRKTLYNKIKLYRVL